MHICRLLSSVHFIPPNAHRRVDLSLHIRARSARKAAQPAEARACRSDHDRPRTANVHLGTVHHELVRSAGNAVLDSHRRL